MAEWLRRGLQILAPRFDPGRGLHFGIGPGQLPICRGTYELRGAPSAHGPGQTKMTADFSELRVKMVDGQVRTTDVTNLPLLTAMLDRAARSFRAREPQGTRLSRREHH